MAKAATATNDFDPEIVNSVLGKIDSYDAELLSERGSYMSKCRTIRENMKSVMDDAAAQGIPRRELKTLLKIRKNEKKNAQLFEELEHDERDNLARLAATEKVMDLPLWRSAKPAAPVGPRGENPAFEEDPQGLRHARFKPIVN